MRGGRLGAREREFGRILAQECVGGIGAHAQVALFMKAFHVMSPQRTGRVVALVMALTRRSSAERCSSCR